MKKPIITIALTLITIISFAQIPDSTSTTVVGNLELSGVIKTNEVINNSPDYVVTIDTLNKKTTHTGVSEVTTITVQSLIQDTIAKYLIDSIQTNKLKLADSSAIAISSDGDTLATMPSMRDYVDANIVSLAGIMQIERAEVLYTNTAQTSVISLPIGSILWQIDIYIETSFNDSGTDYLDIGITTAGDNFVNNLDLSSSAGTMFGNLWGDALGLPNRPSLFSTSETITFTYTGQNSDATQGKAYIYFYYYEF